MWDLSWVWRRAAPLNQREVCMDYWERAALGKWMARFSAGGVGSHRGSSWDADAVEFGDPSKPALPFQSHNFSALKSSPWVSRPAEGTLHRSYPNPRGCREQRQWGWRPWGGLQADPSLRGVRENCLILLFPANLSILDRSNPSQ